MKPLTFRQAAEGYLAGKLASWVAEVKGTPMEPAAITWAKREGFILPNENLDDVSTLNLFPLVDLAQSVRNISCGVNEGVEKKNVAAQVLAGLREAEAGINAIRFPASQEPIPSTLGPDAKDGSKEVPQTPQIALQGTAKGCPEACASDVVRIHRFQVGGVQFYTLERKVMEYVQSAQVQGRTVVVEWAAGEHGNRALRADLRD